MAKKGVQFHLWSNGGTNLLDMEVAWEVSIKKDKYRPIEITGSDTDKPINVARRLAVAQPFLPARPCRLLDCGCGTGGYVLAFDSLDGVDAYGLEYDESKVCIARERGLTESQVLQGDIEKMPYSDGSFDAVLLNEVLEHVPDHNKGLSEVRRVLRPGGVLLVFSPNRYYPFETHGVRVRRSGNRLPYYVPFIPWIPLSLGTHFFDYSARNYWPGELRRLLRRHGFSEQGRYYVWQTFENISGAQPVWMGRMTKVLRKISLFLEHVPLVKAMGVSQFQAFKL